MTLPFEHRPIAGAGLGLRSPHYADLMAGTGDVPWLEVLADNYAHGEGLPLWHLEGIRERYPVVFHGVGLSLGSADPLDSTYLDTILDLVRRFEPAWYSEHLAWTSSGGRHHHELLPLPFMEETVQTLVDRVRQVQDRLGQRMLVENSATYTAFDASHMTEAEFVGRVLEEADCLLLLDVNNLYVNARNHGFDPSDYLRGLPAHRVAQMHLAGHDDHGHYLVDAHGSAVAEPVWELYAEAARLFPGVPVCVEWDREVPSFDVLLAEMRHAGQTAAGEQPVSEKVTPHAP